MHIFFCRLKVHIFLSKVNFFMFLPQGLNVRKLRCLLEQALRLYYPVNAAFRPPCPLPSSGVKPTKGKTQLFVCCLPLCFICPVPKTTQIPQFPSQSHASPSIPPSTSNWRLVPTCWWHWIVCDTSIHSTVWRKQKSGLQYWGSSWSQKGTQRAQCPHSQFERGDYSLQINNVREEDGGTYSCRVEHGDHVTETIVTLRVIKGEKIKRSLETPEVFTVYTKWRFSWLHYDHSVSV